MKMNQEICNKFISLNIVDWNGPGMLLRMDGERTVKKLLEGKPGRGRIKVIPRFREDGCCRIGFEKMKNESFGQKRLEVPLEGSQGQTQTAVVLKNKKNSIVEIIVLWILTPSRIFVVTFRRNRGEKMCRFVKVLETFLYKEIISSSQSFQYSSEPSSMSLKVQAGTKLFQY
jgi:hypothetical protein